MNSGAVVSGCGVYRYWLGRRWADLTATQPVRVATFVMLNPSTADATADDPTIRRCIGFARRLGCGGLNVVNLFAYRSPSPLALKQFRGDPVGPDNNLYLQAALLVVGPVIAAWGVHGLFRGRDRDVKAMYAEASVYLHCLGKTKDGHPKHPLYLPADAELEPLA